MPAQNYRRSAARLPFDQARQPRIRIVGGQDVVFQEERQSTGGLARENIVNGAHGVADLVEHLRAVPIGEPLPSRGPAVVMRSGVVGAGEPRLHLPAESGILRSVEHEELYLLVRK